MCFVRSYKISIPAWSVGTCLSMKSSPQTVLFDAATIFGGIIQEGKPKPGDSLPSNKRDEMKALTEQTRRTVKVRFNNFTFILNTNHLRLRAAETVNDVVFLRMLPWQHAFPIYRYIKAYLRGHLYIT